MEIKSHYFLGPDDAMEPVCSTYYVTDGTMRSVGHLFAASLCSKGPAPNFLSEWVFDYIIGGPNEVFKNLPNSLGYDDVKLEEVYEKVIYSFSI